jgi:hypothetical protein
MFCFESGAEWDTGLHHPVRPRQVGDYKRTHQNLARLGKQPDQHTCSATGAAGQDRYAVTSQQLESDLHILVADGIAASAKRKHLCSAKNLRSQTGDTTAQPRHAIEQLIDGHITEPRAGQLLCSVCHHVMIYAPYTQASVPQTHCDTRAEDSTYHRARWRAENRAGYEEDAVHASSADTHDHGICCFIQTDTLSCAEYLARYRYQLVLLKRFGDPASGARRLGLLFHPCVRFSREKYNWDALECR